MIVYYGITIAAAMLATLYCRLESQNRRSRWLAFAAVVFVFSFFAGTRSLSVGTDTGGYGISAYNVAKANSLEYFYFNSIYEPWAPLIKLMIWCAANIGPTPFFYFFALEALAVIPMLFAAVRLTGKWLPLSVAVFSIVFYPLSFNLMRQMVSMGFALTCFERLTAKRWLSSIVAFLLALSFHDSAYIALLIFPFYFVVTSRSLSLMIKAFVLLFVSGCAVIGARPLLSLVSSFGYYAAYVSGSSVTDGGGLRTGLELAAIFLCLSMLAFIFLHGRDLGEEWSRIGGPLSLLVLLGIVTFFLLLVSLWLYRIGLYFVYFSVLLIPIVTRKMPRAPERTLFVVVAIVLLVAFSYDYYAICLSHEVVPYRFSTEFI